MSQRQKSALVAWVAAFLFAGAIELVVGAWLASGKGAVAAKSGTYDATYAAVLHGLRHVRHDPVERYRHGRPFDALAPIDVAELTDIGRSALVSLVRLKALPMGNVARTALRHVRLPRCAVNAATEHLILAPSRIYTRTNYAALRARLQGVSSCASAGALGWNRRTMRDNLIHLAQLYGSFVGADYLETSNRAGRRDRRRTRLAMQSPRLLVVLGTAHSPPSCADRGRVAAAVRPDARRHGRL